MRNLGFGISLSKKKLRFWGAQELYLDKRAGFGILRVMNRTLIGFPQKTRPFPSWIAKAASEWLLYLTKPNPFSRCMRTSSIAPAPKAWK